MDFLILFFMFLLRQLTGCEEDVDALELSGNNLVNACFEAYVKHDSDLKESRDRRKYGYEAFFFEKFVNRRYFDPDIYRAVIQEATQKWADQKCNSQSSKELNDVKREVGTYDPESSLSWRSEHDADDEDDIPLFSKQESPSSSRSIRSESNGDGEQQRLANNISTAATGISRRDRNRLQRKRLSARNLLLDEKIDNHPTGYNGSSFRRSSRLSPAGLDALKQELLSSNNKTNNNNNRDRVRRASSNPRLSHGVSGRNSLMKRASSRSRISSTTTASSSNNNINTMRRVSSAGTKLHASFSDLFFLYGEDGIGEDTTRFNASFPERQSNGYDNFNNEGDSNDGDSTIDTMEYQNDLPISSCTKTLTESDVISTPSRTRNFSQNGTRQPETRTNIRLAKSEDNNEPRMGRRRTRKDNVRMHSSCTNLNLQDVNDDNDNAVAIPKQATMRMQGHMSFTNLSLHDSIRW